MIFVGQLRQKCRKDILFCIFKTKYIIYYKASQGRNAIKTYILMQDSKYVNYDVYLCYQGFQLLSLFLRSLSVGGSESNKIYQI